MASAGPILLRGSLPSLYLSRLAIIHKIMHGEFDEPTMRWPEVFNVDDMGNKPFVETTGFTGFSEFTEMVENEGVNYDNVFPRFDKRYTPRKWGKGFQISMESQQDDMDAKINKLAPALGRSGRITIEKYAWSFLNNGFTTVTTADASPFFSATHPLSGPEGGTYSNLVTGDLAIPTLEAAFDRYNEFVDDRGLPLEMKPAMIIASDKQRWILRELLQSQLRPDTTDNAINPLGEVNIRPVLIPHYITGAKTWFMATEPRQHSLNFFWKMRPSSDFGFDFETGSAKTKMLYRCVAGPDDGRGWVASAGL